MTNASTVPIVSVGVNFNDSSKAAKVAKISDCGDYAVVIDNLDQVQTLRISTGECWRVPVRGRAYCVALSPKGEFAVASDSGTVQRFDLTLPTICLSTLTVPSINSLTYDQTGSMLLVAQTTGRVQVYDLEVRPTPLLIETVGVSDGAIPVMQSKGSAIVGVDRRGRLFYLRNAGAEAQLQWNGASHLDLDCYAIAVHPYLNRLVVGGYGRYVRFYSSENAPAVIFVSSFGFVRDLFFLPNHDLLVIVGDQGLEVWNVESNQLELAWKSSRGKVLCVREINHRLKVLCG